jgi:hypothetical protein
LLSRTATASAIGNAPEPMTNIVFENQKRRNPLYDQREPASNSFTVNVIVPGSYQVGFAFRLART